jgi:predicted O-methyltransferase YrrM
MNFTNNWFESSALPNFANLREKQFITNCENILEIGCYEGAATCWMLGNMLAPDGTMFCIDTFKGGNELEAKDMEGVKDRFIANTAEARKSKQEIVLLEGESTRHLCSLMAFDRSFDFIYVDGSHEAPQVLTDACLAFELLKPGKVMIFDDYVWGANGGSIFARPKIAIDAFTTIFSDRMAMIGVGYQMAIMKRAESAAV